MFLESFIYTMTLTTYTSFILLIKISKPKVIPPHPFKRYCPTKQIIAQHKNLLVHIVLLMVKCLQLQSLIYVQQNERVNSDRFPCLHMHSNNTNIFTLNFPINIFYLEGKINNTNCKYSPLFKTCCSNQHIIIYNENQNESEVIWLQSIYKFVVHGQILCTQRIL